MSATRQTGSKPRRASRIRAPHAICLPTARSCLASYFCTTGVKFPPESLYTVTGASTHKEVRAMNIHLIIGPVLALIAGILILMIPRLLNYIVAIYLIIIGLVGLFG